MTRVPKSEIQALKRAVPLAEVIAERVTLSARGKDLIGCCPFHEDDTPSLVVTPAKGLWHCFGCQRGGSAIDWTMHGDGVEFLQAFKQLKAKYMPTSSTAAARPLLAKLTATSTDAEVLAAVSSYYAACFDIFDDGRAYLEGRGISSVTARRHQAGFAAGTLGEDLPKLDRAGVRRRLQDVGVLRHTGHEHFRGCVVLPLILADDVVSFYGRRVGFSTDGQASHLYPAGVHRGVFNPRGFDVAADADAGQGELILCESVIDALSFLEQGIDNVSCTYGTNGVSDDIVEHITSRAITSVLCAFDADAAGELGCDTLRTVLATSNIEVVRVTLPPGLDVNDYANTGSLRGLIDGEAAPPAPPEMLPPPKPSQGLVKECDEDCQLHFGDRRYEVRGLQRLLLNEGLKVQLIIERRGVTFSDSIDLFVARARSSLAVAAAKELDADIADINRDLMSAFHIVDDIRRKRRDAQLSPPPYEPSELEREEALALLRDPKLVHRIIHDFDRCGVVGEEINKLVAYLGATSRKMKKPLAVLVQSESAAGKSSLIDAALSFIPDEDKEVYSALTGQALFYAEMDLSHKVLSVAEEEGAQSATYALKILQSEGRLQLLTTTKDPSTGQNKAKRQEVKGPVSLLTSTTSVDVDEELQNRCITLTVDESREQTRRIHAVQRELETLEGKRRLIERKHLITLHQNAQRLLKPIEVVNNLADGVTFSDDRTRARRDHMKLLTLIRVIAFLHQHQRPTKVLDDGTPYIEVTEADMALAEQLSNAVLRRSMDTIPPKTRELFGNICRLIDDKLVADGDAAIDVWFTVRDVVDAFSLSDTIVTKHLSRLQKAELIECGHRSGHSQRLWYRVVTTPNAFAADADAADAADAGADNRPAPTASPDGHRQPYRQPPIQPGGAGGFLGLNELNSDEHPQTASPLGQKAQARLRVVPE
jgi:DNA primase catalytic core